MKNLATLALDIKKPKKAEAQAIIEGLYNGNTLSSEDMAKLYKYFMPAKPRKPKTVFDWVYSAVSKEKIRPYLHHVWSDGQTAVATDGHRLHKAALGLPEGFYDQQGNKLDIDFTFPNWQRVIPDNGDQVLIENITPFNADAYQFGEYSDYVFQMQYIDAANALGEPKKIIWSQDGEPCVLDYGDHRQAVVMPKRL